MAITQMLARVSTDRLRACRHQIGELDQLLNLKIDPPEAYIDLNWATVGLEKGLYIAGEFKASSVLARLFGDFADAVHENNPDGPNDNRVYSRVTYADQQLVAAVLEALQGLSAHSLDLMLTHAAKIGVQQSIASVSVARTFYRTKLSELVEFIAAAAASDQVVIAWWD